MRVVIQRVASAAVRVDGRVHGEIATGLLILLGIEQADDESDVDWLVRKIPRLRLFPDQEDQMNLDVRQVGGGLLVVSQFTLHAATRKGNRPSFIRAAAPHRARRLYDLFVERLGDGEIPVASGCFAADMQVTLVNDGPVTLIIDSRARE